MATRIVELKQQQGGALLQDRATMGCMRRK
jgi:hypothetical protein